MYNSVITVFTYFFFGFSWFFGYKLICRGMKALHAEIDTVLS